MPARTAVAQRRIPGWLVGPLRAPQQRVESVSLAWTSGVATAFSCERKHVGLGQIRHLAESSIGSDVEVEIFVDLVDGIALGEFGDPVSNARDGLIRLNMAAFVPQPGDVMQMFYFGRNLADHVAAACANVSSAGAAPFLDRSVHYDGLSEAQAAALEAYAREKAQLLLLDVNRTALAMLDSGEARAPGALRRVNLGVYLFKCDDLPPDPGQPT